MNITPEKRTLTADNSASVPHKSCMAAGEIKDKLFRTVSLLLVDKKRPPDEPAYERDCGNWCFRSYF